MPVYAFNIQKAMAFHGGREDLGNTYHYQLPTPDEESSFADIVGDIVNFEQLVMPADVDFVRATVWGPTDGPERENVIIDQYDLTETGAVTAEQGASLVTAAVFVAWPLPRSEATNRRRRLGKYLRPAYAITNDPVALSGRGAIGESEREFVIDNYASPITELPRTFGGESPRLCTADGVAPNQPPYVKKFITTRQIRD